MDQHRPETSQERLEEIQQREAQTATRLVRRLHRALNQNSTYDPVEPPDQTASGGLLLPLPNEATE